MGFLDNKNNQTTTDFILKFKYGPIKFMWLIANYIIDQKSFNGNTKLMEWAKGR